MQHLTDVSADSEGFSRVTAKNDHIREEILLKLTERPFQLANSRNGELIKARARIKQDVSDSVVNLYA